MQRSGVGSTAANDDRHLAVSNELLEVERLLLCGDMLGGDDGRTLFLITADHGHENTAQVIDIRQDPRFAPVRDAMSGFGGDERFLYLYAREGMCEPLLACLNSELGDVLSAVDRETALQAGLFGDPARAGEWHPEIRGRVGDIVIFPRPGVRFTDSQYKIPPLVSIHAGLSPVEMLVPLIWRRL